LVAGVAAGAFARFVLPGRQTLGLYGMITLGLFGSVLGGAISAVSYGFNPMEPGFHAVGLVMATMGALILLASYATYSRRSERRAKPIL